MHLYLLIGPVKLRSYRQIIRILEVPEQLLNPSLSVIGFHDFGISPLSSVGEEKLLSEDILNDPLLLSLINLVVYVKSTSPSLILMYGDPDYLLDKLAGKEPGYLPF